MQMFLQRFIHLPLTEHLKGLPILLTAGHLLPLCMLCVVICAPYLAVDIKRKQKKTSNLFTLIGSEIICETAAKKL